MGLHGTPVRFSFGPESEAQPAIDALVKVLKQLEGACVVVAAMSWVDSSVVAGLLLEQGHEVIGVHTGSA